MRCIYLNDMFPYELVQFKKKLLGFFQLQRKNCFPVSCTKVFVRVYDFSRVSFRCLYVTFQCFAIFNYP